MAPQIAVPVNRGPPTRHEVSFAPFGEDPVHHLLRRLLEERGMQHTLATLPRHTPLNMARNDLHPFWKSHHSNHPETVKDPEVVLLA